MEAMNTASLHSWLKSGWTCQHQPAQPSQCIECAGEIAPFLGHPNLCLRLTRSFDLFEFHECMCSFYNH